MCDFKMLHECEQGCVIRCRGCECLSIVYGNTTIALTQKQFYEFMTVIDEYYQLHQHQPEHYRCIYIPTSSKAINLLFSISELKNLIALLNEAYLTLQVENLLATDKNQQH